MKYILNKSLIISFLLFAFLVSCNSPDSKDVLHNWKSMEGMWKSYKGVVFNESWKLVNDSLFEGAGFSLNGYDTVFYEKLGVARIGDSVYYQAYLSGSRVPVTFTLTNYRSDEWVFVNKHNEFPKKIRYVLDNDTILTVTASDMEENKKQMFYLKKDDNR